MRELTILSAGISDGQQKVGVDGGAHRLLKALRSHSDLSSIISQANVIEPIDFGDIMSLEHAEHESIKSAKPGKYTRKSANKAYSVAEADEESFVRLHRPLNVGYANFLLNKTISSVLRKNDDTFLLTLGGDHSIAIGTISGIIKGRMQNDNLTVVWVDAHADFHTPHTTPSGNIHGCPVGFLMQFLGTNIPGFRWLTRRNVFDLEWNEQFEMQPYDTSPPYLSGNQLVYFGLRDLEQEEVQNVKDHGVHAYWMTDIQQYNNSISNLVLEALSKTNPQAKIHLSFDIDSLDPKYAPSTGTPVQGGLSLDQGIEIVRTLAKTGRLSSMDLVEVNPCIGDDDDVSRTLESAISIISAALTS